MTNWKVILRHSGRTIELDLKAKGYADAYLEAGITYPNSTIVSIKASEQEAISGKKRKKKI